MITYVLEKKQVERNQFVLQAAVDDNTAVFAIKKKTVYGNFIPINVLTEKIDDEILLEMMVMDFSFEELSQELQVYTNRAWKSAKKFFKEFN